MSTAESEFEPSKDLTIAVSWRIAAEIMRRHSDELTVIETHPGGGMYDCLTILGTQDRLGSVRIELNRNGSAHITPAEGQSHSWTDFWKEVLSTNDLSHVVNEVKARAGLEGNGRLPSSNGTVLVYRLIAWILAGHVFDRDHWDCRNGVLDSSGDEDSGPREELFARFLDTELKRSMDNSSRSDIAHVFRFWFVLRNDKPVLLLDAATGTCWTGKGARHDLLTAYKSNGRSVEQLACQVMTGKG